MKPTFEIRVGLVAVDKNFNLGNLKGSNYLFKIHSNIYHKQPSIIQGAVAGGLVTARGVFVDVIKMVVSICK